MKFHDFTLDPFQENSIKAIDNNHSVVVSAPTGSGKTLIADYIIHKNIDNKKRIIYTAPIKALSNQKYKDFTKEYGEDMIGLMTGDIVINPHAKVLIMTTEIYRNMVVGHDREVEDIAYVIFDEVHYINDIERGSIWEESIIYSSEKVRFLALSATIPNAQEFADWITAIKKHPVDTVVATHRNVPLTHQFFDYELGITTLNKIKEAKQIPHYNSVFRKKGQKVRVPAPDHVQLIRQIKDKVPCLFFSFSRKDCQKKAEELMRARVFKKNPKIMEYVRKMLADAPSEIGKLKSTRLIKETLAMGIGFHHAGLLPIIKEIVENLFGEGLIKVLYTTETFAVGINMPAKTVCFASLRKYDGFNFRYLNTKEYFQIAGRAGRRGIDTEGLVISMIFRPTFNYSEVKRVTKSDVEPIKSQFKLSVNTVLNLIQKYSEERIEYILRLSFFSYQKFGEDYDKVPTKRLMARYNSIRKKLSKLGFVEDGQLTPKGHFASHIFASEITIAEIFATDFIDSINEYEILLLLGALVYEPRQMNKFYKTYTQEPYGKLVQKLRQHPHLGKEKKFLLLKDATAFTFPMYQGDTFFDVLKNSNLLEGDLIRIYAQVLDRIGQIKKATGDVRTITKIRNCEDVVRNILEGIYLL
jgi:superfamily II RNA helicase